MATSAECWLIVGYYDLGLVNQWGVNRNMWDVKDGTEKWQLKELRKDKMMQAPKQDGKIVNKIEFESSMIKVIWN